MKKFPKLSRDEESVLLVLYEVHPLALSEKEIIQKIEEKGLLEMSEKEFKAYAKSLYALKNN
jgi:hypothetical protein